jgi:hypothetical protein
MFDLLLSAAITTSQAPIIAQAQAATVYLPISTTQSSRQNCVTYKATNATSRAVKDVNVNRRNSAGKIYKYSLSSFLAYGTLGSGESVNFDLCDNSFVNVEAKQ